MCVYKLIVGSGLATGINCPHTTNNGFQKKKKVNEWISSPLKRKSVATDCNKGFV